MTAAQSRIVELASKVYQRTLELDDFLQKEGCPSPSFTVEAAPVLPLSPPLLKAQYDMLEACTELQALIEAPLDYLTRITSPRVSDHATNISFMANEGQMNILMSLHAISRFNIATSLNIDEEVTYEEIARRCKMPEDDARRFLRNAVAHHIFFEPREGVIAHSAVSKLIAEDVSARGWISTLCDEIWPASCQAVPAMEKWPGSEEPEHTGVGMVDKAGRGFWDILREDPIRAQRFAECMEYLQRHPGFSVEYLFSNLEWTEQTMPRLLVDVGGSQGSIATALLRKYPGLKCCVQDLPEVVQGAQVPKDVEGRLQFLSHNFFTPQVSHDADAFYLRAILHDWSDKYAIMIIKNLIPALKQGSRVIVNEIVVPEHDALPFHQNQFLRGYDLVMKHQHNSKERSAEEWKELFERADERFSLSRIVGVPGSLLSVIEFVWKGTEG